MTRAVQGGTLRSAQTLHDLDACRPGSLAQGGSAGPPMRGSWYRAALWLCVLGAVVATGCAPATRSDITPIALRFIAEDPYELFTGRDLFREEDVFTWKFDTPEDLSPWRPALLEKVFPPDVKHVTFRAIRRFPRLFRRVQIDADSIQLLRLVAEGLRYEVVLYWSNPGQRHSRDRRIIVTPREPIDEPVKTYDFYVAGHPYWTGRTKEIRLDPTALPKQEFRFRSIRGIKFILVPERLQAAFERPWKVELRREVRNALVVPPGKRIERELVVPEDAELQFAYGFRGGLITPPAADPIAYRVSLRRGGGDAVRLFEARIDPTLKGSTAPGWKEGRIDLGPYAGQRIRLIVETAASETWQAIHGFPVWANPEVLHRTRRTPYDPESAGKPGAPEPAPPNLIILSLGSLRADHMSLYGYGRPTSPNIEAWARRVGVTFQSAVAQAPSTLPSHTSMLTGLDAASHQVRSGPAPSSLTTLAEVLRRSGYATVALTGGGQLGPEQGLAQGFDRYGYWVGRSDYYELIYSINRLMGWIEANADRPFFLFYNTFEVSDPFYARAPYASEFGVDLPDSAEDVVRVEPKTPRLPGGPRQLVWPDGSTYDEDTLSSERRAAIVGLYDSGVAHADDAIGQLLNRLRKLRLEQDTLVILTADHGEALGKDGRVGHGQLSGEDLRVPLVLAFPRRIQGGRVISAQVRSVDIVPTVLALLGLPPLPGIDGESLVPLMESGT